jgi:hypothetical protein
MQDEHTIWVKIEGFSSEGGVNEHTCAEYNAEMRKPGSNSRPQLQQPSLLDANQNHPCYLLLLLKSRPRCCLQQTAWACCLAAAAAASKVVPASLISHPAHRSRQTYS